MVCAAWSQPRCGPRKKFCQVIGHCCSVGGKRASPTSPFVVSSFPGQIDAGPFSLMATVSSSTTRASRDRTARCRSRTGGGYVRHLPGDAGFVGRRRRVPQHVPGRRRWCPGGVIACVGAWRRVCRALRPGAASVSGSTAPTEILEQVGHPLSNRPNHVVILHVSAPQRRRRCRHRPLYHFHSVPARRFWSNRESDNAVSDDEPSVTLGLTAGVLLALVRRSWWPGTADSLDSAVERRPDSRPPGSGLALPPPAGRDRGDAYPSWLGRTRSTV
jgi:hypothetical protein